MTIPVQIISRRSREYSTWILVGAFRRKEPMTIAVAFFKTDFYEHLYAYSNLVTVQLLTATWRREIIAFL